MRKIFWYSLFFSTLCILKANFPATMCAKCKLNYDRKKKMTTGPCCLKWFSIGILEPTAKTWNIANSKSLMILCNFPNWKIPPEKKIMNFFFGSILKTIGLWIECGMASQKNDKCAYGNSVARLLCIDDNDRGNSDNTSIVP